MGFYLTLLRLIFYVMSELQITFSFVVLYFRETFLSYMQEKNKKCRTFTKANCRNLDKTQSQKGSSHRNMDRIYGQYPLFQSQSETFERSL